MTEPLTIYELGEMVRARDPDMRIYSFMQVEGMRNDLCKYGAGFNQGRAKIFALRAKIERVEAIIQLLRDARDYDTADALRAAIKDDLP